MRAAVLRWWRPKSRRWREQTAKATGDIGRQITEIQAATEQSVNAIREISGTIERLSEISSTIAAAVEEQGAATQEISRNVQQAAQGTTQVSAHIADVRRVPRDRIGLVAGAFGGAIAVGRQQPPQARSRQVPELGARGLRLKRFPRSRPPLLEVQLQQHRSPDLTGVALARSHDWEAPGSSPSDAVRRLGSGERPTPSTSNDFLTMQLCRLHGAGDGMCDVQERFLPPSPRSTPFMPSPRMAPASPASWTLDLRCDDPSAVRALFP